MSYFATGPISIAVSPERVTLTRGPDRWEHEAAAWVDPQGKVRGIGGMPILGAAQIPLFGSASGVGAEHDRSTVLNGFFMEAISQVVTKAFFRIRPAVTVTGAASLASVLSGYQKSVLRSALIEAGAMTVTFE